MASHFFINPLSNEHFPLSKKTGSFIDSGTGDVFSALAVVMMDALFNKPKLYQKAFGLLLGRYDRYFLLAKTGRYLTLSEHVQHLLNQKGLARVIDEIAYVLRQLAVDEFCTNPVLYRSVWRQKSPVTPKQLRESTMFIDGSVVLAALSCKLDLSIVLQTLERDKELYKSNHYGPAVPISNKLIIRLQDNSYYLPYVLVKTYFNPLIDAAHPPLCASNVVHSDPELSSILKVLKEDEESRLVAFNSHVRRLSIMVAAGELDEERLRRIYIVSLGKERASKNCLVGTEHGSEHYFNTFIAAPIKARLNEPMPAHDDSLFTQALITALSRDLSLGVLDPQTVFARLESQEKNAPSFAVQSASFRP